MKVSVIVPIFNSEQYLDRCLKSIINQTMKDIEIICVNDGSTDNSLNIIEGFARDDSRIVVINKENGGLVSARKAGVSAAQGDYIGYVDSDDWIDVDMYQSLYDVAVKSSADMVTSGYILEGNYRTVHFDNVDEGLYEGVGVNYLRDNFIYYLPKRQTGIRGSLWCKLFKRDILLSVQNDVPNDISFAEDKVCLIHFSLHAKSIYVNHFAKYHWCINSDSMTHKGDSYYLAKVSKVYNYLIELYNHDNFTEIMKKHTELYMYELITLGMNRYIGLSNKNMVRIDPIWMNTIPQNASILIYGGGELGDQYKRQLSNMRKDVTIVKDCGFEMPAYDDFAGCDLAVIGIKNEGKAMEVKTAMMEIGIPEDRILWTPQPEFFWKYAEAEGLLD